MLQPTFLPNLYRDALGSSVYYRSPQQALHLDFQTDVSAQSIFLYALGARVAAVWQNSMRCSQRRALSLDTGSGPWALWRAFYYAISYGPMLQTKNLIVDNH